MWFFLCYLRSLLTLAVRSPSKGKFHFRHRRFGLLQSPESRQTAGACLVFHFAPGSVSAQEQFIGLKPPNFSSLISWPSFCLLRLPLSFLEFYFSVRRLCYLGCFFFFPVLPPLFPILIHHKGDPGYCRPRVPMLRGDSLAPTCPSPHQSLRPLLGRRWGICSGI